MATAKENLEDFITCSVCLEKFEGRDPRLLPCGHAFCLACVQDIHKTATAKQDNKLKDDEFRCPQCTTISGIPGKSVTNYPKYFQATHIQLMLNEHNPSICRSHNRAVTAVCFTCTKLFCDACLKVHNNKRRYNNHACVEVSIDNVKALMCKDHNDIVEAFCTDCCKAVCAHCQMSGHEDHNINDFIISLQGPETPKTQNFEKQQAVKGEMQRLETMQREFNAHITNIQVQITKHTEMMVSQIREQSKTLQAELARHQAETNRELENIKKRYKESDDMIKEARAQISQLTQPIPELRSISLQNMDELISDIQKQIPQISTSFKDTTRYQFTPQTDDVLLGYLSEIKQSLQKVKTSPSKQGIRIQAPHNISNETRLITKIDTGLNIYDISWTPTGNVLVAAGPNNLKMYNTQGKELPAPCDLSGVEGCVWSVAVHQPLSTVAIVAGGLDDNHLYITSLGGGRQARRVCQIPGEFPKATFTAGGDVLVFEGCKLHKYNTEGTKLWESNTKHQAQFITATQDNKIIITGHNQLSVHDQDGRWLSSFPRDTATLCDPKGICADSTGHVFVADCDKQAVLMYTLDGTYVREMVRVDGSPVQLAIYQDKYLAVGVDVGEVLDEEIVLCVYNIM